jgi:hypothetical protein
MKRNARAAMCAVASAAALLGSAAVGTAAAASPPVLPTITSLDVIWDFRQWDDGTIQCTSMVDAWLDPAFTKGPPISAQAVWYHEGQVQVWTGYWPVKRGAAKVRLFAAFGDAQEIDSVTVQLMNAKGDVSPIKTVSTANTCLSG